MSATLVAETQIGYEDLDPSSGSPVVFLPGGLHSRCLRHPDPVDGVRVITVDRPGYGLTAPTELKKWPRLLTGLLDQLGIDRAGLVAWSAGTRHALACVAADPTRFSRVALAAPEPEVIKIDRHPMAHLYRMVREDPDGARQLAEHLLDFGLADLDGTVDRHVTDYRMAAIAADPRLRHALKASLCEATRQGAAGMLADAANSAERWPFDRSDLRALIKIYAGRDDPLFPPALVEPVADALDAELVIVGTGHDVPLAVWPEMLRWAAGP